MCHLLDLRCCHVHVFEVGVGNSEFRRCTETCKPLTIIYFTKVILHNNSRPCNMNYTHPGNEVPHQCSMVCVWSSFWTSCLIKVQYFVSSKILILVFSIAAQDTTAAAIATPCSCSSLSGFTLYRYPNHSVQIQLFRYSSFTRDCKIDFQPVKLMANTSSTTKKGFHSVCWLLSSKIMRFSWLSMFSGLTHSVKQRTETKNCHSPRSDQKP